MGHPTQRVHFVAARVAVLMRHGLSEQAARIQALAEARVLQARAAKRMVDAKVAAAAARILVAQAEEVVAHHTRAWAEVFTRAACMDAGGCNGDAAGDGPRVAQILGSATEMLSNGPGPWCGLRRVPRRSGSMSRASGCGLGC